MNKNCPNYRSGCMNINCPYNHPTLTDSDLVHIRKKYIRSMVKNDIFIETPHYKFKRLYLIPIKILGSGAYGTVIKTIDIKTKFPYAVKIEKNISKSNLKNEYRLTKHLNMNNNVMTSIMFKETKNDLILVSYFFSTTLEEYFDKIKKESDIHIYVLHFARNILNALEYIHSLNIVHRDIKPSNIMYNNGNFYLIDFGLALKYENSMFMTKKGYTGTPFYMSIKSHNNKMHSPIDELESLGYSIMYIILRFYDKKMPWRGSDHDDNKYSEIRKSKLKFMTGLVKNKNKGVYKVLPKYLIKYFKYVNKLDDKTYNSNVYTNLNNILTV